MNARSWILLITFAVGFLCAWLAKPGVNPPPPTDLSAEASEAQEPRQPRRLTALQRRSPSERQADARIAEILDDGQRWQPGADEDYLRLLEALRRRASLTGTKYEFQKLLNDLVLSWYDSNPDQALSWVLSIGNADDQKNLLELVVDHCADDDWWGAVELAELYGSTDGGKIRMPSKVRAEIGKLAPEEFARISQLFAPPSPNLSYEFGDEFQFRETLELLGGEYRHHSLLEEWARRDFGAAWEWSYARIKTPNGLQGMAVAWSKEAGNDEVAEFAARLMDESNWDPEIAQRRNWSREQWRVEHMLMVRDMLMSRPSSDTSGAIQSLLERVSDRQESLNGLLRANLHMNGSSSRRYREELLNQMTADERLTAFESLGPYLRRDSGIRENFEGALTLLGHSAEEIDWMLSADAPEDSTQAPESNRPAQDPFD